MVTHEPRPNLVADLSPESATYRFIQKFKSHAIERAEALATSDPLGHGHLLSMLDDPLLPVRLPGQSKGRGQEKALDALVLEDLVSTPKARYSDFLYQPPLAAADNPLSKLETKVCIEKRVQYRGQGAYLWEGVYTEPDSGQVIALVSIPIAVFTDGSELPGLTVITTSELVGELDRHGIPRKPQVHPSPNFKSQRRTPGKWAWLQNYTHDMEVGYPILMEALRSL